jgi:hypothetical protein
MTQLKGSKTLKIALALVLMLALSLGAAVTALAAGPVEALDEDHPAEAAITKVLQMPLGTNTPANISFTFSVAPGSLDGDSSPAELAEMPTVGVGGAPFGDTGTKTIVFSGTLGDDSTASVKRVYKEVNLFSGVTTWPHAGIYHYIVREYSAHGGYTLTATETLTYDSAFYDVFVYVYNKTGGGYYIGAITTQEGTTPASPGTPAKPGDNNKVDGTPGTPEVSGSPGNASGDYSGLIFTNTYYKTSGSGPAGPADSALAISKTVSGALASTAKYFDYTLTLNKPAVVPGAAVTYKAYVLDAATNAVVTDAANGPGGAPANDTHGDHFVVTSGMPITLRLKHGQKLAFGDLHIGATYTLTEQGAANWVPEVTVTTAGVVAGSPVSAAKGQPLTIGSPTAVLVADGANLAAFTNSYDVGTPTGLDIDDLPFLLMLVLAAGAIVVIAALKVRRNARASGR